jgi:hypothetical protein
VKWGVGPSSPCCVFCCIFLIPFSLSPESLLFVVCHSDIWRRNAYLFVFMFEIVVVTSRLFLIPVYKYHNNKMMIYIILKMLYM